MRYGLHGYVWRMACLSEQGNAFRPQKNRTKKGIPTIPIIGCRGEAQGKAYGTVNLHIIATDCQRRGPRNKFIIEVLHA